MEEKMKWEEGERAKGLWEKEGGRGKESSLKEGGKHKDK